MTTLPPRPGEIAALVEIGVRAASLDERLARGGGDADDRSVLGQRRLEA